MRVQQLSIRPVRSEPKPNASDPLCTHLQYSMPAEPRVPMPASARPYPLARSRRQLASAAERAGGDGGRALGGAEFFSHCILFYSIAVSHASLRGITLAADCCAASEAALSAL